MMRNVKTLPNELIDAPGAAFSKKNTPKKCWFTIWVKNRGIGFGASAEQSELCFPVTEINRGDCHAHNVRAREHGFLLVLVWNADVGYHQLWRIAPPVTVSSTLTITGSSVMCAMAKERRVHHFLMSGYLVQLIWGHDGK